jgi:hypothetical protein
MSATEQIDNFIAENGGNTRDALNIALAKIELLQNRLSKMETARLFPNYEGDKHLMSVPDKDPYIEKCMAEKQGILANHKRTEKSDQRLKELEEILAPYTKSKYVYEAIATDILHKINEIINKNDK